MLYPLSYQGADRLLPHRPVPRGFPLKLHVYGTGIAAHRFLSARSVCSAGVSLDHDRGDGPGGPVISPGKTFRGMNAFHRFPLLTRSALNGLSLVSMQ